MGARDEPLFVVISTQSNDPQHILSQLIDDGLSATDPTTVTHLYAVPDDADPWDEAESSAAPLRGDERRGSNYESATPEPRGSSPRKGAANDGMSRLHASILMAGRHQEAA